ncbi:MAG: glycosyltransferase family 1 protein [Anaerolineae bacterium]|nr:glycosyltransferase family 1 protein [Anaerolineae bacterium]
MTNKSRVTLLVFGTRGEIQPVLALGLGMQAAGYAVQMVTQTDFYEFVSGRGLPCVPINFDLRRMEKTRSAEGTYGLLATYQLALQAARQCLAEIWDACKDTDALVLCDLGIIPGWHVMEKLQVPTFVANFFPEDICHKLWDASLRNRLGSLKQKVAFTLTSWLILRPFLNGWRKRVLGLPAIRAVKGDLKDYAALGVPMLYAYSPAVFPKPVEWLDTAHVVGYWFLDRPADWAPSPELVDFLAAGPPPVYAGFGSVSYHDMQKMTDVVVAALAQTHQRGILAAGWSNLGQRPALSSDFLAIEGAPHDWLFPQVAAAIHHGGAGTTAIALRSGIPNIIVPFAFDNPFWAWRIEALGLGVPGIPPQDLTTERLAEALTAVLHDEPMRARREEMSRRLQAEDGVARALEIFERYL